MKEVIARRLDMLHKIITRNGQEIVRVLLRVGVATAFIYPAVEASFYPDTWVGFFPVWIRSLPVDNILLLHMFGASEVAIALWILFSRRIFIPSVLAAGYLLAIVAIDWRFMDMLFRDVAILAIPLSLAVMHYPWKSKEIS